MKNTLIFIVFVLAVIGILSIFSGTRSPRIPEDDRHKGIVENKACLECHGPDKEAALKKTHPPKYECLLCHKTKRRVKAA